MPGSFKNKRFIIKINFIIWLNFHSLNFLSIYYMIGLSPSMTNNSICQIPFYYLLFNPIQFYFFLLLLNNLIRYASCLLVSILALYMYETFLSDQKLKLIAWSSYTQWYFCIHLDLCQDLIHSSYLRKSTCDHIS